MPTREAARRDLSPSPDAGGAREPAADAAPEPAAAQRARLARSPRADCRAPRRRHRGAQLGHRAVVAPRLRRPRRGARRRTGAALRQAHSRRRRGPPGDRRADGGGLERRLRRGTELHQRRAHERAHLVDPPQGAAGAPVGAAGPVRAAVGHAARRRQRAAAARARRRRRPRWPRGAPCLPARPTLRGAAGDVGAGGAPPRRDHPARPRPPRRDAPQRRREHGGAKAQGQRARRVPADHLHDRVR